MGFLTDRQAVLAGNIANASTPGYLERDISFKSYVAGAQNKLAMTGTDTQHKGGNMGGAGASGIQSARFIQHNGNAVRLDEQMVKMNQTKLDYQMMTQIYAKHSSMQKLALGRQQ